MHIFTSTSLSRCVYTHIHLHIHEHVHVYTMHTYIYMQVRLHLAGTTGRELPSFCAAADFHKCVVFESGSRGKRSSSASRRPGPQEVGLEDKEQLRSAEHVRFSRDGGRAKTVASQGLMSLACRDMQVRLHPDWDHRQRTPLFLRSSGFPQVRSVRERQPGKKELLRLASSRATGSRP